MLKNEIKLKNPERFLCTPNLTHQKVEAAANRALARLEKHLEKFGDSHFRSSYKRSNEYAAVEGIDWRTGMGTGMYWLAYQFSGNEKFRDVALKHGEDYIELVKDESKLNDHDTGFKFSPSLVAQYKVTGDERAKEASVKAADIMLDHYCFDNHFIIRVGKGGRDVNPLEYRTLVDSMMNIPLFFWATEVTGDKKYFDAAVAHYRTTEKYLIREDGSSFHHYQFDPATRNPLYGVTLQGHSNDSCWTRGHSWLVYGFPIAYSYTKNEETIRIGKSVTNYFLNNLPKDFIPYWDFDFTDGSIEPRDASAAAIAVCGLLEMIKYLPDGEEKTIYKNAAYTILNSIIEKCEMTEDKYDGLMGFCTGSKPHGTHVSTIVTYGDFFYLEALMRVLNPDWKMYW